MQLLCQSFTKSVDRAVFSLFQLGIAFWSSTSPLSVAAAESSPEHQRGCAGRGATATSDDLPYDRRSGAQKPAATGTVISSRAVSAAPAEAAPFDGDQPVTGRQSSREHR